MNCYESWVIIICGYQYDSICIFHNTAWICELYDNPNLWFFSPEVTARRHLPVVSSERTRRCPPSKWRWATKATGHCVSVPRSPYWRRFFSLVNQYDLAIRIYTYNYLHYCMYIYICIIVFIYYYIYTLIYIYMYYKYNVHHLCHCMYVYIDNYIYVYTHYLYIIIK